jgi:hypothetical protein
MIKPVKLLVSRINKIRHAFKIFYSLDHRLSKIQLSLGRIESRQLLGISTPSNFNDYEFQVFSQFGEDGLIQYLIDRIEIKNKTFIEFGVEQYKEANTRFLLINNGWSGLVMDGSSENIQLIKSDDVYWRTNLKAVNAFIDCSNINQLIGDNGLHGEVGLLSIDIDGNDYWVWQSLEIVSPQIVVCEFNALWGPKLMVSIPYAPLFSRGKAHYSNLYFGASLAAMASLGRSKGYSLVGVNLAGNNAFFVKNDCMNGLISLSPEDAWRPAKFRESRARDGGLSYLSQGEGLELLRDMKLVNVETGESYLVGELYDINK